MKVVGLYPLHYVIGAIFFTEFTWPPGSVVAQSLASRPIAPSERSACYSLCDVRDQGGDVHCSTNGDVFRNECEFQIATCLRPSIQLANIGSECCDRVCTMDYQPHCGTNGITYTNRCSYLSAVCKDPGIGFVGFGSCEDIGSIYHPRNRIGSEKEFNYLDPFEIHYEQYNFDDETSLPPGMPEIPTDTPHEETKVPEAAEEGNGSSSYNLRTRHMLLYLSVYVAYCW